MKIPTTNLSHRKHFVIHMITHLKWLFHWQRFIPIIFDNPTVSGSISISFSTFHIPIVILSIKFSMIFKYLPTIYVYKWNRCINAFTLNVPRHISSRDRMYCDVSACVYSIILRCVWQQINKTIGSGAFTQHLAYTNRLDITCISISLYSFLFFVHCLSLV